MMSEISIVAIWGTIVTRRHEEESWGSGDVPSVLPECD